MKQVRAEVRMWAGSMSHAPLHSRSMPGIVKDWERELDGWESEERGCEGMASWKCA